MKRAHNESLGYKWCIGVIIILHSIQIKAQKVYSVKYANQAEVKVFVVKYENQADLKVFKVKYKNQSGENDGNWFFVDNENQAEKKIFFVDYENQADLKIYFVKYKNHAGWVNRRKVYWMY